MIHSKQIGHKSTFWEALSNRLGYKSVCVIMRPLFLCSKCRFISFLPHGVKEEGRRTTRATTKKISEVIQS